MGIFAGHKILGESSYFQEGFLKMFWRFFCIKKNDREACLCFYLSSKNKLKSQNLHCDLIFDHTRNTISVLPGEGRKSRSINISMLYLRSPWKSSPSETKVCYKPKYPKYSSLNRILHGLSTYIGWKWIIPSVNADFFTIFWKIHIQNSTGVNTQHNQSPEQQISSI